MVGRERLGQAIDIVPGLIVCGAPGFEQQGTDAGGVLVYRLDRGLDQWIPEPWLTVPGAGPGDGFGAAVASNGTSIAVGSSSDRRVAVFDRNRPGDAPVLLTGGPDFGRTLAMAGDTLAVGEPQREGVIQSGRVLIFTADGKGGWSETQTLAIPGLGVNTGFGESLALQGDLLLVGAPSAFATGAGFLFRRDPQSGLWTLDATVQPDTLTNGDQFGAAVAIGDRELVIGAPASDAAINNGGACYIIPLAIGTGAPKRAIRYFAPVPGANQLFGSAVAADGDLVLISAPLGDGFAGEAWVYRRQSDESFVPAQRLTANNGEAFAGFGTTVALSDEFIAAGAPQLDASPFEPDAGRVAVYDALAALGFVGDCNGNGTDDLVDLFISRTETDCNGNGRIDACEIADNPSLDADGDGVLDGCVIDCPADQNFDGLLTPADFNAWLLNYNLGCP